MTQLSHPRNAAASDSNQPLRLPMSTTPILLIASSNAEKVRELKQYSEEAWKGLVHCTTLFDKTIFKDEEKRLQLVKSLSQLVMKSPQELALEKAKLMAKTFSCFALAEETLLIIPVLGNEEISFCEKLQCMESPAEGSLPFASLSTKRIPNTQKVLEKLSLFQDTVSRSACLVSYLAFSSPDGSDAHVISSRLEGYIADEEKGSRNYEFGSIFIKHEYSKTLSELPQSVYLRISHRLKGIQKLIPLMREAIRRNGAVKASYERCLLNSKR